MKKKYLSYALVPALALTIFGASQASAHFGFGFMNNATPEQVAQMQTDMFQKQAELLGVSVDDVKNAWAQGKTLQELAAEKGISQEQLQQKVREQRTTQMKSHLQILVDKGVITQAQADQRLQVMEQRAMSGKAGKGFGERRGMGMMF